MTQAYPLQWPDGWPRTPASRREYSYMLKRSTFEKARDQIMREVRLLNAEHIVLSSNVPLNRNGEANSNAARAKYDDPGVAIYFTLRDKPMSMARDLYDNPTHNLRSLGLAVEHLRGLERHGGAQMMERAFSGFSALPPPSGNAQTVVNWREEFGPIPDLDKVDLLAIVESRYRRKAKDAHADAGGSDTAMILLNSAIAQAREELK